MSLTVSLQTALASLQATQAALQVVSNNVANVNTEGYTRKTVGTQTQIVSGRASGVRLSEIERNVDNNLLRQLRDQLSKTGHSDVVAAYFQRTQQLFGSPGSNSDISHLISRMATTVETLATSPEDVASRYDMISQAILLTGQFQSLTDEVQRMRADADQAIAEAVIAINTQLESIDDLNRQITRVAGQGLPTADLKDVRDTALAELSKLISVQSFERSDGQIVVLAPSGRPLIDNGYVALSHDAGAQFSPGVTYPAGIDAITYGPGGPDITTELTGGRIGGLIEMRDIELVNLQAEIDRLAESTAYALNAAHNGGTAYPPPSTLTSTRSVAGADTPFWSGTFRVTVVDSAGAAVENLDIDLGGITTVTQLATAINGMTNASASINASGKLVLSASGGNGIAVADVSSSIVNGSQTTGVAQFFGLNDLFTADAGFSDITSNRVASNTAALGVAGTLSVSSGGTTTAVAYVATDSLTDIATAINAAVGGQNIVATVVNDADGYRLAITDTDGDNVFLSDSGTLDSLLNLRNGTPGAAGITNVRSALRTNPNLLSSGLLSTAGTINVGDPVVNAGDGSAYAAIAAALNQSQTLTNAGGLPVTTARLAEYAGRIVANNSTLAAGAQTTGDINSSYSQALGTQIASISEVNIDEEMAQIIILQNAYQASARVTTTVSEMMDTLLSIGT
jgi:flagellar hook-associated protein 1 FlgK